MSDYSPDRWVIVEVCMNGGESIKKVLASWYGGYLGSDRWKLSSGITQVIEHELYYEVHNHSGSIYRCRKDAWGMSGYTSDILKQFVEQLKDRGTITVLNKDSFNEGSN